MTEVVGKIENRVIELLGIEHSEDSNIYMGDSNIKHMLEKHPYEFDKYKNDIRQILAQPDYIGLHNNSIEYVKEYQQDEEYVKIAVRTSLQDKYYARTIYTMNKKRVESFIKNGRLIEYNVKEDVDYNT